MKFDAEGVQQTERRGDGHWNGHRRNQSHAEGQQRERDQNHRGDGDAELADKVFHALSHHLGLIRNHVDLQVGRKQRAQAIESSVKFLSEIHDIVALLHLDREQDGALAPGARILRGVLVHAPDLGKVA